MPSNTIRAGPVIRAGPSPRHSPPQESNHETNLSRYPTRDSPGDRGAQLREFQSPLLPGVVAKELVTQIMTHLTQDKILAGTNRGTGDLNAVEIVCHSLLIEIEVIEPVDCGLVDGEGIEDTVHRGKSAMLIVAPVGEARKVIENLLRVGVKSVRAVAMNQNSMIVIFVVGVAGDVQALVDNENGLAGRSEAFSQNAPRETGANNQDINSHYSVPL